MSIQRIVRLAAYDGSLHYFSDQPIAEGKACDFPTIALATQFLERFKLSDLADIEELARWIGAEPIVNVHREKNTFADYLAPLSQALVHRHLHVVQIASVNPTGGLPAAPTSPPKAKPSKPTSDGKSEAMSGEDRVSQESHPESSKNHETAGDPVSMVTGEEILTLTDITLHHGLVFSRTYRSSRCDSDSGLGYGWRHNFDFQLLDIACDKGSVTHWQFIDEMGDAISFPAVNKGAVSYQIYVGASCFYQETGYALVTLASGAQYKFERIEGAWLLKQIRPNILTLVTLDYSSKHRLIGVSFNQCHCFELQYDQRGHLIEIREPHSGRVFSRYRYDPQDCLISATNQQGQTEHYEYTDAHLILRRRRNTGFNHYFEWLGEGSSAQCVRNYGDEQIYDYRFQYSEHNSSFTDTLGHQWTFRHSDEGQLLEKQSPEGRLWRWDYNPLGKLVTEHFPDGSFMRYQYNAYGQRCAQHHSSGATTHYQYNPLGQLTMVEYPDGEKQHQHYNSLGQLLWRSEPEGSVTHYQYDKFGRLIQSQSEHGEQCQWWWNEAEQLIAQQTNQTLLRYSYDESHHLNGIAYPDGMLLALEYDERGQRIQTRLYSERDDHQREVRYHYDDFGRITQVVTPAGCSIIEWSKLAQPEALLRPDGAGLAFDYDGERNLTALTRSDGASYHFTLSEEGHLTQTCHFDGTVTDYQYDAAGRLSHLTCDKRQVLFHYDLRGNLTLIRAGGESGVSEHHFQFSAGDKLCLASNTHRTVSYHYQANGLLREQTQGLHTLAYRYHPHGQLSDIHLPSGETVKFDYTPYGQLSAVSLSGQSAPLIEYEYDVMGRLYRLRYANQQEEKQFDGIGRLCQQRWSGRERKYYFDGAQYLAIIMDSEAGTTHYHYDAVGQLTRVTTRKREEKYQYDPFGNPSDAQSQCSGDKLLEHGGWRYQYDAQGNQSQAEGEGQAQHRRFNALNQLVAVENNGGLSHYEYDALGRRSRKITEAGVTEFIWHESQLIGEYHQGRYRWYVYQPDSHIPALLLEDGQHYVYQCDHLGTPLRLVTPEGDVVWQAHYETWGEAQIAIERVVNPLRFQGQYYDGETGLHYNLARYYDPRTGRFIQPDPIGLLGGLNHYQYAPNPVMWIDPTGLCAKEDSTLPVDALAENPQQTLITSTLPASYQPTTLASSSVGQLSSTTSSNKSTDLEKLGSALSNSVDKNVIDQNTSDKLYALAEAGVATPAQIKNGLDDGTLLQTPDRLTITDEVATTTEKALNKVQQRQLRYLQRKTLLQNTAEIPEVQQAHERLNFNNDNILRAEAAQYVYKVDEFNRGALDVLPEPPLGLQIINPEDIGLNQEHFTNQQSGFGAALFKSEINGETMLTYRGTNNAVTGKQDWLTNLKQGSGLETEQYNQAMDLARQTLLSLGDDFSIVGHSLGGGLASSGVAVTGQPGYTFNSAGLHLKTAARQNGLSIADASKLITTQAVKGEVLTMAQSLGTKAVLAGAAAAIGGPVVGLLAAIGITAFNALPKAAGTMLELPSIKGGNSVAKHGMDQVVDGIEAQKAEDIETLSNVSKAYNG